MKRLVNCSAERLLWIRVGRTRMWRLLQLGFRLIATVQTVTCVRWQPGASDMPVVVTVAREAECKRGVLGTGSSVRRMYAASVDIGKPGGYALSKASRVVACSGMVQLTGALMNA